MMKMYKSTFEFIQIMSMSFKYSSQNQTRSNFPHKSIFLRARTTGPPETAARPLAWTGNLHKLQLPVLIVLYLG